MNLLEAKDLADTLLDAHGLRDWRFEFFRGTTTVGLCVPSTRTIKLSKPYTVDHTEDEVGQVLLHEIAHAHTPGHGHDRVWLRKAREIGYRNGGATFEVEMSEFRYQGRCNNPTCSGVGGGRNRITTAVLRYVCTKCGGPITWTDSRTGETLVLEQRSMVG